MNTNSNSYTIIYASVMVVIVAFLLAFVSSSLKETQNKNVELDTKKQILAALNVRDVKDADAEYNKYVKADMLMNADGTLTENTGAFATGYEKEVKENNRLHVFVCEVDGAKKYVTEVSVDNVEFVGRRNNGSDDGEPVEKSKFDDEPKASSNASKIAKFEPIDDDDLPF